MDSGDRVSSWTVWTAGTVGLSPAVHRYIGTTVATEIGLLDQGLGCPDRAGPQEWPSPILAPEMGSGHCGH